MLAEILLQHFQRQTAYVADGPHAQPLHDLDQIEIAGPGRAVVAQGARPHPEHPFKTAHLALKLGHPLGYGMPAEAVLYHRQDLLLRTELPRAGAERRVVARFADACNINGTPDELAHKLSVLRGHCEAVGRDYGDIVKPGLRGEPTEDGGVTGLTSRAH